MNAINNLRDRALVRLLSQPTRDALFRSTLYDIEAEMDHFCSGDDTEHVAYAKCHLADLMEERPRWVAELRAVATNG